MAKYQITSPIKLQGRVIKPADSPVELTDLQADMYADCIAPYDADQAPASEAPAPKVNKPLAKLTRPGAKTARSAAKK